MADLYCPVRSMQRVQLWLMLVCSFTTCLVSFIIYMRVCTFLLTKQQRTSTQNSFTTCLVSFIIYVIVCTFLFTVSICLLSAGQLTHSGGHA
jgi:ABC-type arginine transport system permease subunit